MTDDAPKQPPQPTLADAPAHAVETSGVATRPPGGAVGPYTILGDKPLGIGGFGEVWLAERRAPYTQRVALKIIKAGMDSRAVIARFEQERQALALMDHPNVARVLDGGLTDQGRPYFAMEYVRGEPITAFCDRHRLTLRQRLALFVPVCEAVQHAHLKGIIHRDLKPGNILASFVEGAGAARDEAAKTAGEVDGMLVKVIDFGVAKATTKTLTDKNIYTETGQMIGTPEYMSPEQAEMGATDVDTRTDVYALGVVLYELLAGALPFDPRTLRSKGYDEIRRIIRTEEPPRPSTRLSGLGDEPSRQVAWARLADRDQLVRQLRREAEWIPLMALRKERDRRYQSPADLAGDIKRYLTGDALQAGPESRRYRVRKFARRYRAPLAAAATIGLLLVAGLVGIALALREARTQQQLAEGALGEARTQTQRAEEAARSEAAQREASERQLYISNVLAAGASIDQGAVGVAAEILRSCDPARRGWEWGFHMRRCDQATLVLGLRQHDINDAAFSADGARVFAAHENGSVTIWDAESGRMLAHQRGHDGPVNTILLSPDGRQLVTTSSDQTAGVWDASSGAPITKLRGHTDRVKSARFSPDGTRVVTASGDSTACVWPTEGGHPLVLSGHAGAVTSAAFSPDGRRVVTASVDTTAKVWDATDGRVLATLNGHSKPVWSAEFSPDGLRVCTASADNTAGLWDASSGSLITVLQGHEAEVSTATFSPSGRRVATASSDRTVRVWNAKSGALVTTLRGPTGPVWNAAFSPNGLHVIIGSYDGAIYGWDAEDGAPLYTLRGHTEMVRHAVFSADGARILSCSIDGTARVWMSALAPASQDFRPQGVADFAALAPNGTRLMTATPGRVLRIWNIDESKPVANLEGHRTAINAVAWSRDQRCVATMAADGALRVWDVQNSSLIATVTTEHGSSAALDLSPDGAFVVFGSAGNGLRVVPVRAPDQARTMDTQGGEVRAVSLSPDGRWIAYAASDGNGYVCSIDGGNAAVLHCPSGGAYGVRFSPRGDTVLTTTSDKAARLWDAQTGRECAVMRGHRDSVHHTAFSPDGSRIVTTSFDSTTRVWDAATGRQLAIIPLREPWTYGVRFSPDGADILVLNTGGVVQRFSSVPRIHAHYERLVREQRLSRAELEFMRTEGHVDGWVTRPLPWIRSVAKADPGASGP